LNLSGYRVGVLSLNLSGYRVGDENGGWSPLFSFRATPSGPNWSPVVAVYGDLGNRNGRSIGRLQTEAQYGTINAVFHIGGCLLYLI